MANCLFKMSIEVEGTEERVCRDIAERQKIGKAKYGVTVEQNPLTLRQWLQHAYEETLDQAIYLRRAMEDMDVSDQLLKVRDGILDCSSDPFEGR